MVANTPVERPQSPDYLINRLRALEQAVDELGRRSKVPFTVSHNGTVDFSISRNASGSATVQVNDGSGHLIVGSDPTVGYGLSRPYLQTPMYPTTPGVVQNTSGTFASYMTGITQQLNSCFVAQWRMNTTWGGAGTGAITASYVKLVDTVTNWTWTSPTVTSAYTTTTSPGLVTTCGTYAVQVPSATIGHLCTVDIYSRVVAGGSGSSAAITPQFVAGTDFAYAHTYIAGTQG